MKSTRLLALSLATMMAGMGSAAMQVIRTAHTPRPPKTAEPSRTVGNSRNGGRRSTNMAARRAAIKHRNVKRHRAHMKGRRHVAR